jgi:hypothetical protein
MEIIILFLTVDIIFLTIKHLINNY